MAQSGYPSFSAAFSTVVPLGTAVSILSIIIVIIEKPLFIEEDKDNFYVSTASKEHIS